VLLVHKYLSHLFEGNIPVGRGPRRLVDLPFPNLNLTKAKEQGGVCVLASTMLSLVPDLLDENRREDLVSWANRSEFRLKTYGVGLDPPEGIFDYPGIFLIGNPTC